ncbi:MAG: hypothetical protein R3B99_10965 [Polyangiales bacterium]
MRSFAQARSDVCETDFERGMERVETSAPPDPATRVVRSRRHGHRATLQVASFGAPVFVAEGAPSVGATGPHEGRDEVHHGPGPPIPSAMRKPIDTTESAANIPPPSLAM